MQILIVIMFGLGLSLNCPAETETKPTARNIVNTMVAQYKGASSYQDTGTVTVAQAEPKIADRFNLMFQSPSDSDVLVSFKTYFARPRMFRFDWKSSYTRSREASIWFDGRDVYSWMPTAGARDDAFTMFRSKYLQISIDEAAGSSAGTVFPLISILVPEASVVSFADLLKMAKDLVLVKEESVDGEMCYVIKTNLSGAPWTLWIGRQTYLLRKTRTVYLYGSFHERVEKGIRHEFVAEETRRDIKINEPMSKDVFKHRPTMRPHDFDLRR